MDAVVSVAAPTCLMRLCPFKLLKSLLAKSTLRGTISFMRNFDELLDREISNPPCAFVKVSLRRRQDNTRKLETNCCK
jgi:hypothetical protein